MKKIWVQIYGRKVLYEITTNADAYKKVCHLLFMEMAICFNLSHLQAEQHICDTWCTAFGPAAIAAINDFFEANKNNFCTDETRQVFTREIVEDLAFLYSNTESNDPNVSLIFPSYRFGMTFVHRNTKGFFETS